MTTKVLVVDDSAVMRKLLTELINAAPDLEVVGAALDAHVARDMIKTLNPDVVTLDVQMPRMDGLEFLERLMRLRPTRVVMVSAFTAAGSTITDDIPGDALSIARARQVNKPGWVTVKKPYKEKK